MEDKIPLLKKIYSKKHFFITVILLIYAVSLIQDFRRVGGEIDEGYIISMASLFAKGYVPYKGFNLIYGPMGVWTVGYLFKIFGASVFLERTVGASYQLIFIIGSYLIGNKRSKIIGFICGFLTEIFFISGTYGGIGALPWIGGMAFAIVMIYLLSLYENEKYLDNKYFYFFVGLAASISLLFRFDFIITIAPILVIVLFKTPKKYRAMLVLGSSLTLVGYVIQGIISGFNRLYFVFIINPQIQAPGNHLPIPPNPNHLSSFFDVMDMLFSRPSWFVPQLSFSLQIVIMFYLMCALSLGLLAVMVFAIVKKRKLKLDVYALILLELGTIPYALERADSTHILSTLVLAFLAYCAITGDYILGHKFVLKIAYAELGLLMILSIFVLPTYYLAPAVNELETSTGISANQNAVVSNMGRSYYMQDAATAVYLSQAIHEIDSVTTKGSTFFVGTPNLRIIPIDDAFLYYLFPQLRPSSKYILLYPAIGLKYPNKLQSAVVNANIIMTDAFAYSWDEPNTSVLMNPPGPAQAFTDDFCLLNTYGGFSVFVNRYHPPSPLKNHKFNNCRAPYFTAYY